MAELSGGCRSQMMGPQGDYRWQRRVVAPEASGGCQSRIVGGRGKQWGAWWTLKPNGGLRRQVVGGKRQW